MYGIGYADFACYFESEDNGKNFFPAGFIVDKGDFTIDRDEIEKGGEVFEEHIEKKDLKYIILITKVKITGLFMHMKQHRILSIV